MFVPCHVLTAGSSGLCAALEEAQQRVGGDVSTTGTGVYDDPLLTTTADKSTGYGFSDLSLPFTSPLSPVDINVRMDPDPEVRAVTQDRNRSLRSANVQFLYTASKEGLRVISLGMEKAVRQADKRSGMYLLLSSRCNQNRI